MDVPFRCTPRCCVLLLTFLLSSLFAFGQTPPNEFRLALTTPNEEGWRGVQTFDPNSCGFCFSHIVYRLEASTNLQNWREIAVVHDAPFTFFDPSSAHLLSAFYRSTNWTLNPAVDDWKNLITYKRELTAAWSDAFIGELESGLAFVKFAIFRTNLTRVYFQDPKKYPLHYDFVTARLPGFVGVSRANFDQVSLYTNGQQLVLGTVLLPGDLKYPGLETIFDYGIQFVANDPLPPELVRDCFHLVKSAIASPVPITPYYVPSPLLAASAAANASFFASNGLPLTTVERWLSADTVYSEGWALGKLVFVPGPEIAAAYSDGRLHAEDILLTDVVPPEVPYVAGIICLNAATPSSHVAILSQAYKVPFAFVTAEPLRSGLLSMLTHKVIFVAKASDQSVQVLDLQGALAPSLEQELLSYKALPPVNIRPKEHFGAFSASVTNLVPGDARFFGGKAANYGLLSRVIPSNSPVAIAFSMDLWDAFMDQLVPGGLTLRNDISNRLYGLDISTNLPAVQSALSGIRSLIRNVAVFNSTQQVAILSALSNFPSNQNIRFRSSSNAEDSETFTAAGLLDSYSGCVADDTDANGTGPSICDPTETDERGVFRAVQRVYASFYNDNAYLARVRHHIDESKVGVGVLVHSSFPDQMEVANGVATVRAEVRTNINRRLARIQMVTQPGAASVTNPSDDAQAEVARTSVFVGSSAVRYYAFENFYAYSSLLPQGFTALEPADYEAFSQMFFDLMLGYHDLFPAKNDFTLDFEYKKLTNGWPLIKQVREIPPPYVTNVAPYLINQLMDLCVFQGEHTDGPINHNLKLRGTFGTKNIQLTASNLGTHFFTAIRFDYNSNGTLATFQADAADLSNIIHTVASNTVLDVIPATSSHPEFRFRTAFEPSVVGHLNPFVTLNTLYFTREVVTEFGTQSVRLVTCPIVKTNSTLQLREYSGDVLFWPTNTYPISIKTRYFWPDARTILASSYTAFLVQFGETTITGLTSEPIVLTNQFSQSYGTSHHNLDESLVFEPSLDPNVTPEQLAELSALGVHKIYLRVINPDRGHPLERFYQLDTDFVPIDD